MKNEKNTDRREFLKRVGKAGLSIAAVSAAGYLLYDMNGPPAHPAANQVLLPDFSVTPKYGKSISVVKATDRVEAVNKALDLLGGIEHFVKPGDVVLVKPNVAFASSPMLGATTNPETLKAVIKLCYDRGGAKKVLVTDNPINDPDSCFNLSGIAKAAVEAGAEVVLPKEHFFSPTTVENAKLIKNWPVLFEPLRNVNKIIGIAPLKDHHRSGASMTMKNWYGLLGGRRNIFHQDINTIIVELALMVKPTLVILDAFSVMKSNGPTGGSMSDLYTANTIIAGTDQVAVDSIGVGFLDMKISDLPYLLKAEKMGIGTTKFENLKPMRVDIS